MIDAQAIRDKYLAERISIRDIARLYDCSPSYVGLIVKGIHKVKVAAKETTENPLAELKSNQKKYHLFAQHTLLGDEFIKMWNNQTKKGALREMAKHFKISTALVYRIRKRLDLPEWDKTVGRRKFEKRIMKLYSKGYSTERIAKIVKMHSQGVNMILRSRNVELKPQHCTDPLFFKVKNYKGSMTQLLKIIKEKYETGMSAAQISKEIGIDQGTVCTKLKAMGIPLRQNHRGLPGGYPCRWCGVIMEKVWQNKGPKKQIFCNHSCKNKAKDYRRILRDKDRFSQNRLDMLNEYLGEVWGDQVNVAITNILDTKV